METTSEYDTIVNEDKKDDDIFSSEEIKIEELSIDGICGVY